MKVENRSNEVISKTLPLSARAQKGLEITAEGRFRRKEVWGEGLTVLDGKTAKLPLVERKALAIKKVLCEMPVLIKEHELLVGSAIQTNLESQAPFPEYATQEEKEAAAKRLTRPESMWGHFSPYYPGYLKLGLGGLREMAEEKLGGVRRKGGEPGKEAWYESVILCLDGLKALIQRYRDLALKLAENETNLTREGELRDIARISQHLLQNPSGTFREALQALWFAHIAFFSTRNIVPMGRFDQNLWPYLRSDLENGTLTISQAQELIDLLWLKLNDLLQAYQLQKEFSHHSIADDALAVQITRAGRSSVFLGGKTSLDRIRMDGGTSQQFLQTITLSGLTPEGSDGTNPLTYLCLNATMRLGTPQPCLYVRFHDGSPQELYERVADSIRAGCIGPTIYNDEVIIPALVKSGIPVAHARDYTSDGCWEPHIQGRTHFKHSYISVAEALDRVLSPSRWKEVETPLYIETMDPFRGSKAQDPYTFGSFDEVMDLVKEQLDRYIKGFVEVRDSFEDGRAYHIAPLPLLSAFVEGPLESGKDITLGGMEYTVHMPEMAGLSHVVDSLAVIKKLCFEEKTVGWSELLDAIRANWDGSEYLRQLVRTRAPAYGNDVDYVDDIARELVEYYVGSVRNHGAKARSNVRYVAGIATYEHYTILGRLIGATPDGRLAEEPLGTNAPPSIGRAVNGQTAALNSYLKLPLIDLPGGSILDLTMNSRAGLLLQLEAFIKSFVERRGNILSIAVNDCQKLRAARKEPEKYRDLKVRVGGYQAYFVDLPPHHQELQILRCEQYA